jgi:hypothetical protein
MQTMRGIPHLAFNGPSLCIDLVLNDDPIRFSWPEVSFR